jgi:hypothetical protein
MKAPVKNLPGSMECFNAGRLFISNIPALHESAAGNGVCKPMKTSD